MVGTTLSHYRVTRKLGEGVMEEVFLAQDTLPDRQVAIKALAGRFRDNHAASKRLLQEARLAAALDHPYICSIRELLDVGGTSCIVQRVPADLTRQDRQAGVSLTEDGFSAALVTLLRSLTRLF